MMVLAGRAACAGSRILAVKNSRKRTDAVAGGGDQGRKGMSREGDSSFMKYHLAVHRMQHNVRSTA